MQFKGMVGIGQAEVGEEERDFSGEMLGGEGQGVRAALRPALLVMSVEWSHGGLGSQGTKVHMAMTPE